MACVPGYGTTVQRTTNAAGRWAAGERSGSENLENFFNLVFFSSLISRIIEIFFVFIGLWKILAGKKVLKRNSFP